MGFSLRPLGKKLTDFLGTAADYVLPGDQSSWHAPAQPINQQNVQTHNAINAINQGVGRVAPNPMPARTFTQGPSVASSVGNWFTNTLPNTIVHSIPGISETVDQINRFQELQNKNPQLQAATQKATQNVVTAANKLPTFEQLTKPGMHVQGTGNVSNNLPTQVGRGLVSGFVNSPRQFAVGTAQLGQNVLRPDNNPASLSEQLGNVATMGQGVWNTLAPFAGASEAKGVATVAKEAPGIIPKLIKAAREGSKVGGLYGGISGGLEGASKKTNNATEQAINTVKEALLQGGAGALTGGVLGAGTEAGALSGKAAVDFLKGQVSPQYVRDAAGKFAKQTKQAFSTRVTKDMPVTSLTSYEGAPDKARVNYWKKQIASGERPTLKVMPDSTGNLGIQDGKHRFQAYKELGFNTVPVDMPNVQGGYIRIPGKSENPSLKDVGITKIRNNQDYKKAVDTYAQATGMTNEQADTAVKQLLDKARVDSVEKVKAQVANAPKAPKTEPVQIIGNPAKNPVVKDVLNTLANTRATSVTKESTTAAQVATKARELGVKLDQNFINRYESGKLSSDAEKQLGTFIRDQVTNPLFEKQKVLNPKIEYRKNYVPHSYAQDQATVAEAANRLMTSTGAANPRAFNTYAEASQYGLTPQYKTLDQMLASNTAKAERALGNREAISKGIQSGLFTTSPAGGRSPIEGYFAANGEQIYAQKSVADLFNGMHTGSKLISGVANVAKKNQELALTGGFEHINAFTMGQAIKDTARNVGTVLTGHPIRAIKQESNLVSSFARSFSTKATQERFANNSEFVNDLAKHGLSFNIDSRLASSKGALGKGWDKMFQNATFKRYMPNRMLDTASEVFNQATKKGADYETAVKLAADTTKTFYGIVDNIAKGRSKTGQDLASIGLFAPQYREGIINSFGNALKSLTTLDPKYRASRELAIGMAATAVAYDQLNRQLNGHGMLENRKGQELSLQIPYGEPDAKGNQKVLNIPFMPGYATVPRAIFDTVKSLLEGDSSGVIGGVSKIASMPLQTVGRVAANQDYFGRPIYNSKDVANKEGIAPDSAGTIAKKVGLYVGGQSIPGYGRAVSELAQGHGVAKAAAQATEAPVRFGTINPDQTAYFDTKEKFYNSLDRNQKALFDKLNPAKKNINGEDISFDPNATSTASKYADLVSNPEFTAKYQAYQKSQKSHDPLWDLNPKQLHDYMMAQVISKYNPGGDGTTVRKLYNGVPSDLFAKREAYFNSLKSKGATASNTVQQRPKMPDNLVKFSEMYNNLPYGTGARSAALRSPEGQAWIAYLDQNRIYNNQERADLGLPPLENNSSGSKYGYSKGYKKRGSARVSNPYKYAISSKKGSIAAPKAKVSKPATAGKAKVTAKAKPKVSIKKSMV